MKFDQALIFDRTCATAVVHGPEADGERRDAQSAVPTKFTRLSKYSVFFTFFVSFTHTYAGTAFLVVADHPSRRPVACGFPGLCMQSMLGVVPRLEKVPLERSMLHLKQQVLSLRQCVLTSC